jgi:hypothetical protein
VTGFCLLLLAVANGTVVDARVTAEARSKAPSAPPGPLIETDLLPEAGISITSDGQTGHFDYAPILRSETWRGPASVEHQLHLEGVFRPSPTRTQIRVFESFTGGKQDFSPLAPGATGPPRPPDPRLPVATLLTVLSSETTIARLHNLDPTLRLDLSAGYIASGGLLAQASSLLPTQQGPRVTGGLTYAATSLTSIGMTLDYSAVDTLGGVSHLGIVRGTWAQKLAKDMTVRAFAGLSASKSGGTKESSASAPALPPGSLTLAPEVGASAEGVAGVGDAHVHLAAQGSVTSQFDRLTGDVDERADVLASLGVPLSQTVALSLRGGGSRVLSGIGKGDTIAQIESAVEYAVSRNFSLRAGVRAAGAQTAVASVDTGVTGFVTATAAVVDAL